MPTVVWLAVFALLTTLLNAWIRHREKHEDWARQDEVAKRVEKVAVDVKEQQSNVVGRLEQIHTLVNTGRMNDKKQNLGLLLQLKARDERDGIPITDEMHDAIQQLEEDIAELARATALGEAQAGISRSESVSVDPTS